MICNGCKIKKICSIYLFKKEHVDEVSMNISDCKYKTAEVQEVKKNFSYNTPSVSREDASEYEKQILNIETVEEDKTIVTCATCGGTDYAEYISLCSNCAVEVCGNCATNEKGLTYCEKCWGENNG